MTFDLKTNGVDPLIMGNMCAKLDQYKLVSLFSIVITRLYLYLSIVTLTNELSFTLNLEVLLYPL